MNADGGGRHALTSPAVDYSLWFDSVPSFSPDGSTIVFSHSTGDTPGDLVEIPSAGGTQRPLPVPGMSPAWGPARIAFTTTKPTVETVLPDGSRQVVAAKDPRLIVGSLAWSPDGRLAWLEAPAHRVLALAIWNGSRVVSTPLGELREPYRGTGLTWSPDGTRLAFTAADAEGTADIWTVAADGTALTRVTHGLGAVAGLSWTGG
jgi:WD40 repeat protein